MKKRKKRIWDKYTISVLWDRVRELTVDSTWFKEKYTVAMKTLVDNGYKSEHLNSMPESQVILLNETVEYDKLRDPILKWINIPYHQRGSQLKEAEERGDSLIESSENMLVALLPPFPENSRIAIDRDLAILRCVEAIRMYAANNNDKLPASLDDITEVPVPLNPITNKPFDYILESDKAIIQSLLPIEKKDIIPPKQLEKMNVRYELAIRK